MSTTLLQHLIATTRLAPLTHGCPAEGANVSNTLEEYHFIDAGVCPYTELLTLPIFTAFVLVGIINVPIYIRQESAIGPFVLTLVVGGVVLSQAASMAQSIAVLLILFVLGLGPVLVLRRIDRR